MIVNKSMIIKSFMLVAAVAATMASCGGNRGGMPNFGDDEYPVVTVGTSASASEATYPATINGIQDIAAETESVYTLDGKLLPNGSASGINIIRRGNDVQKVIKK